MKLERQAQITGINTIGSEELTWMSTSLLNSPAYQYTVLCLGKLGDDPVATWKSKIKWYSENNHFKEMNRRRHADGVRVENILRNRNVGLPREASKSNERLTVWTWALHRQDHLQVNVQRHWMGRKRQYRKMWTQSTDSCELCSKFPRGHWSF